MEKLWKKISGLFFAAAMAVTLLAALAAAWVLIGLYVLRQTLRARKAKQ